MRLWRRQFMKVLVPTKETQQLPHRRIIETHWIWSDQQQFGQTYPTRIWKECSSPETSGRAANLSNSSNLQLSLFWTFKVKQNAHQLRGRQVDNSPENKWKFHQPTSTRRPSDVQGDDTFCTCPYGSVAATSRAKYFVTSPFTGRPLLQRSINFQLFDRRESEQLITSVDFHSLRENKRRHTATVTTCTRVLPLFCSPLDFGDKTNLTEAGKTSQIR